MCYLNSSINDNNNNNNNDNNNNNNNNSNNNMTQRLIFTVFTVQEVTGVEV